MSAGRSLGLTRTRSQLSVHLCLTSPALAYRVLQVLDAAVAGAIAAAAASNGMDATAGEFGKGQR